MRALITIRLTSPWLGDVAVEPGRGRLGSLFTIHQRPAYAFRLHQKEDNQILVDLRHWNWAWREVLGEGSLESPMHYEAVRMDQYMLAPTLRVMRRKFSQAHSQLEAFHHCINGNAILTIGAEIVNPSPAFQTRHPGDIEQPTIDQLMQALKAIGGNLGVSPYLSDQGYGRFIPIDIKLHTSCGGSLG